MNFKIFTTIVFLGYASLLFFTSVFNRWIDPAHLFSQGKYEHEVAQQLNAGRYVGGVTNYDERLVQKYRLEALSQDDQTSDDLPNILIVGSSRSMQIERKGTEKLLNISVSGASIEDYVALLYMAKRLHVSTVILGVDPWVLNRNSAQGRWKSICQQWRLGMEELLDKPVHSHCAERKWQQLLNFEYTKASMYTFYRRYLGNSEDSKGQWFVKPDDAPDYATDVLRPDGSRVYRRTLADEAVEHVKDRAVEYAQPPVYSLDGFTMLDEENRFLLESLVQKLKIEGKQVIIFLPPYHPTAYSLISKSIPNIELVENYLRELSSSLHITIIGSYDPKKIGCGIEEFVDGMHAKKTCVAKAFSFISNKGGDEVSQVPWTGQVSNN